MYMDTEYLLFDDYEEYNRRTTDYGNGRIEIVAYHEPKIRSAGSRSKTSGKEAETTDEAQEARTRQQIYAIRRRIKGYAFANGFCWFVTLTFNPRKINSSDYRTAKTALQKWCRKMRDRYKRFDYLLIPELHKSGAVHFHGLLGDIPADFVEAVNPKTGKPLIRHGRQVYNLTDWEYGFSDCEKIEDPDRAASYITKYVTSKLLSNKEMYNQKRYFNSQGLAKPAVTFSMSDNTELNGFTPNFGVVETDSDGTNHLSIGIYNLKEDPETKALTQTDTGYLITAGTVRHNLSSPTGDRGGLIIPPLPRRATAPKGTEDLGELFSQTQTQEEKADWEELFSQAQTQEGTADWEGLFSQMQTQEGTADSEGLSSQTQTQEGTMDWEELFSQAQTQERTADLEGLFSQIQA